MCSSNEQTNLFQDISSELDLFHEVIMENIDDDKISARIEFMDTVPSTEELQMTTSQGLSSNSMIRKTLETNDKSNSISDSDSYSSQNSSHKISSTDKWMGGKNFEPSKHSDEVKYLAFPQHSISNQNLEGRLDTVSSKTSPVETIVLSVTNDTKPISTILNASEYEELKPFLTFHPVLEDKSSMLFSYGTVYVYLY